MTNAPNLLGPSTWLTGQLLVAMPALPDPHFEHTVVYICSHSPNGAMGLVINRLQGETNFEGILHQLNLETTAATPDYPVHYGGPVESGRGFILHSVDYAGEGTVEIMDGVALTATMEILQAMARGEGPRHVIMTLGYSGWGAGQLEAEIKTNSWLIAPSDTALLFETPLEHKWDKALAKIGVNIALLSAEAGRA